MKIQTAGCLLFFIPFMFNNAFADKKKIQKNNDPALESKVNDWMQNSTGLRFQENKGQMADLQNKPMKDLLFKASGSGVDMYVTTWGLSYVFTKMEKTVIPQLGNSNKLPKQGMHENVTVHYCRADMELVGADIRKENIAKEYESEKRTDYYLGGTCPDGILNVHSYERITIKNIYSGIDWVLYSTNKKIKYDFVIHPGADLSLIRLKYKWTGKPNLQKDGSMKISTPMGDIIEGTPFSYGKDKAHGTKTSYILTGDEIKFKVNKNNPTDTLVIDPTLLWATYYDGKSNDEINSVNSDGVNVWVTGTSTSAGFPTVNPAGAYIQGSYGGGGTDLILLQFTTCGKLIWASYYGGSGVDIGYSINSDGQNVWVTGSTSSTDFPTQNLTGAYYQSALGGTAANNAFILQFSAGTAGLIWATYYGGNMVDFGNSISSDGHSVWVTGETKSTNFPTLSVAGAYNQSNQGGGGDAFIVQFNCLTSALVWATHYGGNSLDYGNSISSDGQHVWVCGYTQSDNFPKQPLTGAYNQGVQGGNGDGFVLQFSVSTEVLNWGSFYGGSNYDECFSLSSDGRSVWLTGATESTDFPLQPLTGAFYQPNLNGIIDNAFVLQFSCISNILLWATYYGGSGGDIGHSISSDGMNVWVCGSSGSSDFPTMKPACGYFQGTLVGTNNNVFVLQFNTSGVRQWATFYGNDAENEGSFISSDGKNVFVTGDAELNDYPPVNPGPPAYISNTVSTSPSETVFIAKFNTSCFVAGRDTSICNGNSFQLHSSGAPLYSWNPSSGLNASDISNPVATPLTSAIYTVTGTDACGGTTTATVNVIVLHGPTVTAGISQSIMKGERVTLSATGAGTYSWTPSTSLTNPNIYNPIADPSQTTTYTVIVTGANNCLDSANVTITVEEPNPCDSLNFFIPNAFSPNGDGKNDVLLMHFNEGNCVSDLTLQIYDRWGELVFLTLNPEQGWDGKFNGKTEDMGVFFYYITGTLNNGQSFRKKGNIALLR